MKQKYTITVADMELNIISDAAPDEVENIVGILDRRMRDINLKSPRCTKNEAAVLCALSYCSERMAMQEAFKKVEKDAFRFAGENEKLKKTIESMQEEIDNLRKDASVMRSILDHATALTNNQNGEAAPAPEKPKYVPKPFQKKEVPAEQLNAFDVPAEDPAPAIPTATVPAEEEKPEDAPVAVELPEEPAEKAQAKPANKSRVGSMFDLLTFSDV